MSVSILIIIEMFIFIGSDFAVRDSHKQSKRREQSNIIPAMYVIKYINSPQWFISDQKPFISHMHSQ